VDVALDVADSTRIVPDPDVYRELVEVDIANVARITAAIRRTFIHHAFMVAKRSADRSHAKTTCDGNPRKVSKPAAPAPPPAAPSLRSAARWYAEQKLGGSPRGQPAAPRQNQPFATQSGSFTGETGHE